MNYTFINFIILVYSKIFLPLSYFVSSVVTAVVFNWLLMNLGIWFVVLLLNGAFTAEWI
jgi:hypothetical protein